ncbi:MAG: 2Fe-2S iron-sulfur cluster binding domain-containing protein [Gammaproteobacteria bacterium]|nr:2Fe-2S iron-sulfur cluster binding domain-containing protein [Gammaproteobacteria bacterium]
MKYIKLIHKWVALLVGIQLILWLASGLYFNLMDHTKASGNTYRGHVMKMTEVDLARLLEPQQVLAKAAESQSLSLIHLLGQPYYLLTHQSGLYSSFKASQSLINAYTGETVLIGQAMATQLAAQSYTGPGQVVAATRLEPPIEDYPKYHNPLWQINYNDAVNTSVYLSAANGQLIGHSDDDKRLAGLFFTLHFMDYFSPGSFNNWLMIAFAIGFLWLAISGIIWTIELLISGQYRLTFGRKFAAVEVINQSHDRDLTKVLKLSQQTHLLDSLLDHQIVLPSSCGGGGTCGQCQVKLAPTIKVTSADAQHFSPEQLQDGFRLACQHHSGEINSGEIKSGEVNSMKVFNAISAKKQQLTLVSSEFISPYIKELRFKVSDGKRLVFNAGAYMRFLIPAASNRSVPSHLPLHHVDHWHHVEDIQYQFDACSRSYSLANHDSQGDELVFTVKIQGAPQNTSHNPGVGSNFICNLDVGHSIDAVGPFQEFGVNKHSGKTKVFIGAGSGMAPLQAIIFEQLEKDSADHPLYFYFGARTEIELIYVEKFKALASKYKNFNYVPVLSRSDDHWQGAKGYVQHIMAQDLATIDRLENIEFYLCGPKQMMKDTIELLKSYGVNDDTIACDDFVN